MTIGLPPAKGVLASVRQDPIGRQLGISREDPCSVLRCFCSTARYRGHEPLSKYNALVILAVATVLFLANFALGLLVQFRIVDTKPFRWLHHALFFAVFVSAAAAVAAGFYAGEPYRWALLPVLGLFVVLPYVRAGTRGHAALACAALFFYAVGLAQSV